MADKTTTSEDQDLGFLILQEADFSIDAGKILEWVETNFNPERVFSADALGEWAKENGYVEGD